MVNTTKKLSDYGYSFQIKLIASLLNDRQYLRQISDILYIEYFDTEANKFIIKTILDYYLHYNDKPSPDILKVKIEKLNDENLKLNVKQHLLDAYKNFESDDLNAIKDEVLDFCRIQHVKNKLIESVDLLELGKLEDIEVLITNAFKAGLDLDLGHEYNTQIKERYEENPRYPIATPWECINNITEGGLGHGELGIVVGSPGSGKSFTLINLCYAALKQGKNVIYYTLELNDMYVAKRFDSILLKKNSNLLQNHYEDIVYQIKGLPGKLIIKYYPTGSASIITLNGHIEKCKANGFNPDMIAVDYADLMKSITNIRNKRDDQILGDIYKELRGLAGELVIPIWTCSQANRNSHSDDIIEGNSIAGSYEKLMIADLVWSQSRTTKDKVNNTARIHIIKNRFGIDGITFKAKTDLSYGYIDIYEPENDDEESNEDQQKYDGQKINDAYQTMLKKKSYKF